MNTEQAKDIVKVGVDADKNFSEIVMDVRCAAGTSLTHAFDMTAINVMSLHHDGNPNAMGIMRRWNAINPSKPFRLPPENT